MADMKIIEHGLGGAPNVMAIGSRAVPEAGTGEILIKVAATLLQIRAIYAAKLRQLGRIRSGARMFVGIYDDRIALTLRH